MQARTKDNLIYVTLNVRRKMTKKEQDHIAKIEDPAARRWELERYTMLFKIAVRASSEKDAIRSLKKMLKSELVIEKDNGKEVPPTKRKSRRV